MSLRDLFGDAAHRYSRAQAIADGVLIDVTATARAVGMSWPTALTRAAWDACVKVPEGVTGQDEAGRLRDVLFMARAAMSRAQGTTVLYQLQVRQDDRERTPPLVRLKVIAGAGDDGEPVLTILLPDED